MNQATPVIDADGHINEPVVRVDQMVGANAARLYGFDAGPADGGDR